MESEANWVFVKFVSICASARPAARASGEARPSEAGGVRGARVMTSTSRVFGEARAHTARAVLSPARRDFIEKRYVELKKVNPDLPILIRECSDVQPKLWARYGERGTQGTRDPGRGTNVPKEKGPPKVTQKPIQGLGLRLHLCC